MLKNKAEKVVISGVLLALGVLLPLVTAHGFGVPGNIFLPMHLPVLLCGFIAGPLYGGALGLILPFLNSLLTGMPTVFPNAVVMTFELFTYGAVSGLMCKFPNPKNFFAKLYLSLVSALLSGRIVSGIATAILLAFNPKLKIASVIASTLTGLPGIFLQLLLVPMLIRALSGFLGVDIRTKAEKLIASGEYNCVVVKGRKIICAENCRGISLIMKLLKENKLKNTFVADDIIGKAAAVIFTAGGVTACWGKIMSRPAFEWLQSHGVEVSYSTLTENIINREGTGLCPMESAVLDIADDTKAVAILCEKITELRALSDNRKE